MGLGCSKKGREDEEAATRIVRLSPWRAPRLGRRCSSARAAPAPAAGGTGPPPLLALAAAAAAAHVTTLPGAELAALPADLSQLLLDVLVARGELDGTAVAALSGQGLHFYRLPLAGFGDLVRPAWLRVLASGSLEEADLSKTGVNDEALACLGAPPRLARLRLDYCVDVSDTGLALLQGLTALEELSLEGCELLTGLASLAGLTRMRRLNLQTCHAISDLSALSGMVLLERLDLGWCRLVGDADARVLARFAALRELCLARTQITDAGLAHLSTLHALRSLNLTGLQVSDAALAGLLAQLPQLRRLVLDRCTQAGDEALEALGKHAPHMQELLLGYTAVTDEGLPHLAPLVELRVLSLENCSVGDRGLAVLAHLTSLRSLDLSDTAAGNAAMPAVARLRLLQSLNLSFSGVEDWGLRHLAPLTSLRCLNLDSRLFTDAGMPAVAKLTGLECLDLFGARVGDVGCASLSKLTNLRRLEVCGGGVTDAGVAQLARLTRLQHLSLAQNYRVGNPSISHLLALGQLMALNLSQSRVTSNSVVALGCLPQLQTLALHETRVKRYAVEKLQAANPELVVQGVPDSGLSQLGPV